MEENKPSSLAQQQISSVEDSNSDDFYEKIEAPKFVDFTVPDRDRYRPDDRYWFCLRVGCDQKHEEELDPEAINKNFVLRVMAARSPNVRLRKTLSRKCSSANVKCPQSAPAKYSKTRLSRLALISSISHKICDAKVKVRPVAKAISTPNVKAKQSSAAFKALTTPRNKKCLPNPNSFRSIQNIKATTIAVPKNRVIAKALVFRSPKKVVRSKFLLGVNTPIKKVCEGMKKLEITSQSKRILGYSPKSSKGLGYRNKPLPLEASSKKTSARKVKSQAEDLVHSEKKYMDRQDKISRGLKQKRKDERIEECHDFVQPVGVENNSSDMDIDGKGNGSSEVHTLSGSSKSNGEFGHDDLSATEKILGDIGSKHPAQEKGLPFLERPLPEENLDAGLPNASRGDENSVLCHAERAPIDSSSLSAQSLNEEDDSTEQSQHEEKIKSSLKNGEVSEDETSERQTSEGTEQDSEVLISDDKENTSVSDGNRELNLNINLTGSKPFGRHEICVKNQKNAQTLNKTLEKGLTSTAKAVQGVKYKRPKPTNPKPFRLRTDERGILKEANMEKKLHLLEPPKETTTFSRFPIANVQKRHENDIHRTENFHEQSKYENDMNEDGEKDLQIPTKKNQLQEVRTTRMMANKKEGERKTGIIRRTVVINQKTKVGKDIVLKNSEKSSIKSNSHLLQQELVRPRGANSTRKTMVSVRKPGQLSTIEETSSKLSRPKEGGKLSETAAIPAAKPSSSSTSRSSSRGRRPTTTIAREPNFHSIHTPKSCTRQLA